MVTKNITQLPKAIVEVDITMPWADIQPKWDETLQRMAQDVELPGFRKGTAPLPMVEQNLGQKLADEVLRIVMPQALIEALSGSQVVPIDYPRYQVVSFAKGQNLVFKAQVTQRPQVNVGNYRTIQVTRPQLKPITDQDVQKVIEDLFNRWKVRQPQAAVQPAQTPQQPTVVSQGIGDGTSGSLSFGASPTAPVAPQSPTPATAPAAAQMDDNFARAVGAQNLEDLKTKIKADLEFEAKNNNELDYEEAILQEIEKLTQVEVPQVLVEDELNRMVLNLQRRVTEMGMVLDDYLRTQNMTLEALRDKWKEQAERNVKMELGLAEVARQEKVDINDTEVQAEIDKIQDARLKSQFEAAEPRLQLKHNLRQIRTLDLLKSLVKAA